MYVKTIAALILSTVAMGAHAAESAGRDLAEASFDQMDADSNGEITLAEYAEQGQNIFISMDSDDSGDVSEDEFTSWDFGFEMVAQDQDIQQGFATSRRALFDMTDTNLDWKITSGEMDYFSASDFVRADLDRNGIMAKDEFLKHSFINVTARSALMPAENRQ